MKYDSTFLNPKTLCICINKRFKLIKIFCQRVMLNTNTLCPNYVCAYIQKPVHVC